MSLEEKNEWRPVPLQVPEDQQDKEADVHEEKEEPFPPTEGLNPRLPKYF